MQPDRPFAKRLFSLAGHLFLTMLLALFTIVPAHARSVNDPVRIVGLNYASGRHAILVWTQDHQPIRETGEVLQFTNPDRAVLDIPNAVIATPNTGLAVQQDGIDHIELLPSSHGLFYQSVRLLIYASRPNALANLQIQPAHGAALMVTLGAQPDDSRQAARNTAQPPQPQAEFQPAQQLQPAQTPETRHADERLTVLTGIQVHDGDVTLQAQNGQPLRVKKQFTLPTPSRLVIDLADTVLADKRLTVPVEVDQDIIRSVHLGQFDESTVRVVVETRQPNSVYLGYPGPDQSRLALSSHMGQSAHTLPLEYQKLAAIQDIRLMKQNDNDVIVISTSDPMARRLVRHGNRVELDLLNVTAQPVEMTYDRNDYTQIDDIRLVPLSPTEPTTKLFVTLAGQNIDIDQQLSADNKTLTLTLLPRAMAAGRYHHMPQLIGQGTSGTTAPTTSVRRGMYTVVVDPGHGGKDLGANREGVNEKDLNLAVALRLRAALQARGVNVVMTRTTDTFLELSEISAVANRVHPDAFVSIHTNASVNPVADGLETYYYTPQSRALAFDVQRRLVNAVSSPDRGVRTARFYVIHHTSVPAILCEMGYVSNPAERAALQTDTRQQATADSVAQGVADFLGQRYQADAPPPVIEAPDSPILPLPAVAP